MRVLIVSPVPDADDRLRVLLCGARQDMCFVRNVPEALETLRTSPFDLVIVDRRVEQELQAEGARWPSIPWLTFDDAALTSPTPPCPRAQLWSTASRERSTADRPMGRRDARRPDDTQADAVAVDARTRQLFERIRLIAEADSTVLITGETGAGKEIVARSIHRFSDVRNGAFVPVNCGAIPDTLVESELFGHRKGAFTGAVDDRCGLIAQADGGILFLDEIGELPFHTQAVLLRFLDRAEVRRVGDTSIRHVNTRVIAATNRLLRDEVRAGRFREDLYYRLSVVTLNVPPLRERPGDIMPLAMRHLERTAARLRKTVHGFTADARALLIDYEWPGNIRELQNVVETAVVIATADVVTERDLPGALAATSRPEAVDRSVEPEAKLNELLDLFGGNRSRAAAALGISRTTLWRKLRQRRPASPNG